MALYLMLNFFSMGNYATKFQLLNRLSNFISIIFGSLNLYVDLYISSV